ncbi:hypothetical protein CKF54_04030 [Psittacicella hinzii]|uniref:P68 RBP/TagC-like beta-propeller domain-containing protein n=1 Tax=Psittacicella hinzii TaxID=2028575 RepID=A0A3A1Y6F2_9GAMM|nr:hypothetical protein [Psittacicella hinzii]RIY32870.1 hypothetical protein CKF54_04030 [Psittacicella hinzii]
MKKLITLISLLPSLFYGTEVLANNNNPAVETNSQTVTTPLTLMTSQEQTVRQDNWQLNYQLLPEGSYKGNVEQSFVLLPEEKLAFSLRHCGNAYGYCISRYVFKPGYYAINGIDASKGSFIVGHQGLAAQTVDGKIWLWTSAGRHFGSYGRKAIKFDYNDIANAKAYTLFGKEFNSKGSVTPGISADQKYLIARGYKGKRSYIRIWDLAAIKKTDISKSYLKEFLVDEITTDPEYPLQGIASDSKYVYLYLGLSSVEHPLLLLTYTFDGELVGREFITVGRDLAIQYNHYEAEAIQVVDGRLYIQVVTGFTKKRINLIYSRSLEEHYQGLTQRTQSPE